EDRTRHDGGDRQAIDAVSLHDGVDDDHERAGRPADLNPRSSERGDQEAGNDRGVKAPVGCDPAGDSERDREWERDDANDHAGTDVSEELGPGVPA
ncbi:MAG TPA: hypothetical protein VFA43_11615, partial [Gemmatimonadaceae bacterium]|nr:hypothetical protein [Gemmatimonadaceae bacterium]